MIKILKEHFRINLALVTLFFIGIIASAYSLYRLPYSLSLPHGHENAFSLTYFLIAITFSIGIIALLQALNYRKEVVVLRDRVTTTNGQEISQKQTENSFDLNTIKTAIDKAKNETQLLNDAIQSICKAFEAGQGAIYKTYSKKDESYAELKAGYALPLEEDKVIQFDAEDGLIGQAVATGQMLYLDEVPEGYINIVSGLGNASPRYLLIVPIKVDNKVEGVFEIASFTQLTSAHKKFAEQVANLVGEQMKKITNP